MLAFKTPRYAEPLDEEGLGDLIEDDCGDLLVVLEDGETYNLEDLYSCDGRGCDVVTADRHDLDDEGLCAYCAREAREWRDHYRELEKDYRASVL
jgi:hypothetical protein